MCCKTELHLFLAVAVKALISVNAGNFRSSTFNIVQTGNITVNQTPVWQEEAKNEVTCSRWCLSDSCCESILYNTERLLCSGYHSDLTDRLVEAESRSSYLVRTTIPQKLDTFAECESLDFCPPHYDYNVDICLCYRVDLGTLKSQNEGARLLRVTSLEAQAFIESDITEFKDFFIDGKESMSHGEWYFSNGKKITTFFWPEEFVYDSLDVQTCLVLDRYSKRWINKDCLRTEHFICQYDVYSEHEETIDYDSSF